MVSSGEPNIKGIDASVGGLVWVRRKNGSWWPGRIIGFDEVSEGSLVSPRSGTPVKLLGREDATVDWYNLEKSKRVKAFRCGEYTEWIEKAKASMSNSNRKEVKYARRENAIIHALDKPNHIIGTKGHPMLLKRRKTPNDSEDDGKERTKRVRGCENLGMGVGSKGKDQVAGLLKLVQQDNYLYKGVFL